MISHVTTTGRLLEVLSVLQEGRTVSGPELAERFEVTVRTVRRDIDRLRQLGYAIEADHGMVGGYRLGAGGSALPPLMLDEDETLALAVCVRAAAGDSVAGIADSAARALAKLEQSMPPDRRSSLASLVGSTVRLAGTAVDEVDPSVLVELSRACRVGERVRLGYTDARGRETDRRVEPYKVVNAGRRWYLVGHDLDRRDWRTLRLDRIGTVERTGHGVGFSDPPDAAAYVQRSIAAAPYQHQVKVELFVPLEEAVRRIPSTVGILEAGRDGATLYTTGADDLGWVVVHLASLDMAFRIIEPDELRSRVAAVAQRLLDGTSR